VSPVVCPRWRVPGGVSPSGVSPPEPAVIGPVEPVVAEPAAAVAPAAP